MEAVMAMLCVGMQLGPFEVIDVCRPRDIYISRKTAHQNPSVNGVLSSEQ